MTKYYISPTGSDTLAGTSPTTAFASLYKACTVLANNDEVELAGGAYLSQRGATITGKTGFKIYAAVGAVPIINTRNTEANALSINTCDNFSISFIEFSGWAQTLSVTEADNGRTGFQAKYDGNCLSINNSYSFLVQGCRVQDYPGGGISVSNCDYATVDRCQVRRCSYYSYFGNQGITFLTAMNSPGAVSGVERLKATDNVCYNNINYCPWNLGGGNGQINEGNGIYSDTTKRSSGSPSVTYTGVARFEANLCAFNGSAGIHSLNGCPISVVGNFIAANQRNVVTSEIQLNTVNSPSYETNNFVAATSTSTRWTSLLGATLATSSGNTVRGTTLSTPTSLPNNTYI